MLGEQGFIGLGLYLLLIGTCVFRLRILKNRVKQNPDLKWAQHYPDMLQVSIFAYCLGGAFLGRAYFDMFYQLVGTVVILGRLVDNHYAKSPLSAVAGPSNMTKRSAYRPRLNPVRV